MLQKLNAKNYICDVQNISKQVQMGVRLQRTESKEQKTVRLVR